MHGLNYIILRVFNNSNTKSLFKSKTIFLFNVKHNVNTHFYTHTIKL